MTKKKQKATVKSATSKASNFAKAAASQKAESFGARQNSTTSSFARNADFASATTENLRGNIEQTFKSGSQAARDFASSASNEARRVQDNIYSFTKQNAEKVSAQADTAGRKMQEAMAVSRDMLEACVESGNVATEMTKNLSTELFNYANEAFSQNVEMTKDFFTCRTLNDMAELQNRIVRVNVDRYLAGSAKWSNLWFQYSAEASEPFSDRVADMTSRISKSFAA